MSDRPNLYDFIENLNSWCNMPVNRKNADICDSQRYTYFIPQMPVSALGSSRKDVKQWADPEGGYSLGTRCPCTLKQSLLSKITYINTLSVLLSK